MALRPMSVSHHRPSLDSRRSYKGTIVAFTADPIEGQDGKQCVGHKIHYDDDQVRWHDLGDRRFALYRRCARPAIAPDVLRRAKAAREGIEPKPSRFTPRPMVNSRTKVSMYLADNLEYFLNDCHGFEAIASFFGSREVVPARAPDAKKLKGPEGTGAEVSAAASTDDKSSSGSIRPKPYTPLWFNTYKVIVAIAKTCT